MSGDRYISWTRRKLRRFIERYDEACKNGDDVFQFDGGEFLCSYARYLIEYLKTRFHDRPEDE